MEKLLKRAELALCLGFIVFQMYTAFFGSISGIAQKSIHLAFMCAILYIGFYLKDQGIKALRAMDLIFLVGATVVTVYITTLSRQLAMDSTTHYPIMNVFGVLLLVLLLVTTWRKVGPVLAIVVAFFIFYAFYGKIFPSLFRHGGMKFERFIHLICYTSEGIFGSPLNSSATFICVYIILGALFTVTGVGDYITELASSVFGRFRGGPAKIAVVASALFGSISGSACANVIGTGTFTIPLMKKIGYDSEFAGAVEATASTGGQIMPPIMGAAAFLMAEILGVRYWDVVKAAIIPAILFYGALLIAVDIYALHHGLVGVKRSDLPPIRKTLRGIWKLSPMLLLILLMAALDAHLAQNIISCYSPSKTFNIAGLRCSGIIVPGERLRSLLVGQFKKNRSIQQTVFALPAYAAAYDQCADYLEQLLPYLEGNVRYLDEFLREKMPRIKLTPPEATYLMWLDCTALGLGPDALADFFIHKARVAVSRGDGFGPAGAGFVRLNIGCPRATLAQGLAQVHAQYQEQFA